MKSLLNDIRACQVCDGLPLGPRPVVQASAESRIIIIGQAPGLAVHNSGVPWDDKSGENLREWLGVSSDDFYNADQFALAPMGFCYPGKGKSGDLPPRTECAPLWHGPLIDQMKNLGLIILIGKYAQQKYLGDKQKDTLTETVENFKDYLPDYFVLPHPSPRNNIWQAKNPWFKQEVLPELKKVVSQSLSQ